jgi:hypothetical protein
MLRAGRLSSRVAGIQAETVDEVLEQSAALNSDKHTVAAAVLAGGALETHLRHLCLRAGLSWPGEGSIEKYNSAAGKACKAGRELYSTNYGKLVTG